MPCRILLVDDEVNARRSLAITLRLEGFEVAEAGDGYEALERLEVETFDIAFVDIMMPGLNGLELARRLRFRLPTTPVVLTSAYHLSPQQLDRSELAAVGFVPKPYEVDELVRFLKEKAGFGQGELTAK